MSNVYAFSSLTGGTNDSFLDYIDGGDLADGDVAHVITSSGVYFYRLNATSAATENSPFRIAPDSNAGDKRWHLVGTTALVGALVYKATNEAVANNTGVDITFGTEVYDTGNFFVVGSPTRLTVPIGVTHVLVSGNIAWENMTADATMRSLRIYKNGSHVYGLPFTQKQNINNLPTYVGSGVLGVSASDYFTLNCLHLYGSSIDVIAESKTWFSIQAVGFA